MKRKIRIPPTGKGIMGSILQVCGCPKRGGKQEQQSHILVVYKAPVVLLLFLVVPNNINGRFLQNRKGFKKKNKKQSQASHSKSR